MPHTRPLREGQHYRNPLRQWLQTQPLNVTIAGMARDLGYPRPALHLMFKETATRLPELPLALRIVEYTKGKVTLKMLVDFAERNRRLKEAA